jgi:hypothetical protein
MSIVQKQFELFTPKLGLASSGRFCSIGPVLRCSLWLHNVGEHPTNKYVLKQQVHSLECWCCKVVPTIYATELEVKYWTPRGHHIAQEKNKIGPTLEQSKTRAIPKRHAHGSHSSNSFPFNEVFSRQLPVHAPAENKVCNKTPTRLVTLEQGKRWQLCQQQLGRKVKWEIGRISLTW